MNKLVLRVVLCASALFAAAAGFAQEASLLVKIPFDFVVVGQKMPAGEYSIEQSPLAGTITLRCLTSNRTSIVIGEPGSVRYTEGEPRLRFEKRNGEVHLVRVMDSVGPEHELPVR